MLVIGRLAGLSISSNYSPSPARKTRMRVERPADAPVRGRFPRRRGIYQPPTLLLFYRQQLK